MSSYKWLVDKHFKKNCCYVIRNYIPTREGGRGGPGGPWPPQYLALPRLEIPGKVVTSCQPLNLPRLY